MEKKQQSTKKLQNIYEITITTSYGKKLGSWSEEYKLYCFARWMFTNFKSGKERREYLMEVREKHGRQREKEVRDELSRIYNGTG